MSGSGNGEAPSLLPHQEAFADTYGNRERGAVINLVAEPGLGKTTTLLALSARVVQGNARARVLFLVPSPLRHNVAVEARRHGVQSLVLDRYRFRELLDSVDSEFWPRGTIVIVSRDFASQSDVRDSLALARWDLLIALDAHGFGGSHIDVLRSIAHSAGRVILSSDKPLDWTSLADAKAAPPVLVTWRRHELTDQSGRPLDIVRPQLHVVTFPQSHSEINVARLAEQLRRTIEAGPTGGLWLGNLLVRSVLSSPAAAERVLRGILSGRALRQTGDEADGTSEDADASALGELGSTEVAVSPEVLSVATDLLAAMEDNSVDAKVVELASLLTKVKSRSAPGHRVSVVTDFRATLFYLAADIEGSVPYTLLHGGMGADARQRAVSDLLAKPSVLLATAAALEGLNLQEYSDVILYDLPYGAGAFAQVLGRFDRIGRRSQLSVHALVPSQEPFGVIAELLSSLRAAVRARL